jgi:biotin operon repressor
MALQTGNDQLDFLAQPQHAAVTDAGRLRRIAELLCKAIVLTEASQAVQAGSCRTNSDVPVASPSLRDPSSGDDRILNYLAFVGTASPAVIRSSLGLSRTSTHRALRRLSSAGNVVASGQTRGVVYRLSEGEPPPEKIGLN